MIAEEGFLRNLQAPGDSGYHSLDAHSRSKGGPRSEEGLVPETSRASSGRRRARFWGKLEWATTSSGLPQGMALAEMERTARSWSGTHKGPSADRRGKRGAEPCLSRSRRRKTDARPSRPRWAGRWGLAEGKIGAEVGHGGAGSEVLSPSSMESSTCPPGRGKAPIPDRVSIPG